LPEFFEKAIPPHNAVWDMSDAEIDSFRTFRLLFTVSPGTASITIPREAFPLSVFRIIHAR
jgi:hypothetical protein